MECGGGGVMSDYTTTPNLGLYKPTYDADDGEWGNHLNLNSDTLDALFAPDGSSAPWLPLTGGTMTGPLLYTATGGSVARAAQDRAADVANVLDFGADPTRTTDSTAAFQAAAATGKMVYVP